MIIWMRVLHLFLILICEAKKPDEHDKRCSFTAMEPLEKSGCSHLKWHFLKRTKQCVQTCDKAAPFKKKVECEGICRSGAVCDYPMAGAICFGDIFRVYIYNPSRRRCFASYDCSYFGNKFPTLGECQSTCMISNGNAQFPDQTRNIIPGDKSKSPTGQGSANAGMGGTHGSVQANELNASTTQSNLLQKATEQQEITHSFGSSQGASKEHGSFSTSVGQQLPEKPNPTAVRGHLRPNARMTDKRCHIKSETPTHKCRQRWYLDTESGRCLPSCSREAPFLTKVACDGVCRPGITRGQDSSNGTATSSQSTGTPTSSTASSVHEGGTSWVNHVPATQHERMNFFISDYRCTIPPRNSSLKCHTRGWFFDQHTRLCVPSCDRGAFTTRFECIGACRSVEACGFPVESSLCILKVFAVYTYDPIAKGCFMAYDCSLFGNKFPTAKECRRTCEGGRFEALTQKIDYDSLLAAGQQRLVGPPGSSQWRLGGPGGVGFPQFPTGQGQLPGSTQVSGANASWNTSLQHQTSLSQQSSTTSGTGTTIISAENGQQQGAHTSTGSQIASTTTGGASQVITSQSSTGGGVVVSQTTNGHGQVMGTTHILGPQGTMSPSSEQQTGSSQWTQGSGTGSAHGSIQGGLQQHGGQTATGTHVNIVTGSISTNQVSTSQSSAGGIIVTQVTNGQQESQKQTGIIKEGSSQRGNQGPSGGQQMPHPELKLPTIKVSRPAPPPIDEECKVTVPYEPTRRCRRPRWYYDSQKKACRPSCTRKAPFYNKIACDGVCRTVEACDFPMASIPCFFRKVHVVYIYNQWRKKCMMGYDCSYFGNKFPTFGECQRTCKLYEDLRHIKNTTESSSQVSTKRKKIISTMTHQQKMSQSTISSVQGSLSSQTSQGQTSTGSISSNAQLSQSLGQSATQHNSETSSGVQMKGTGQRHASSTSISSQVSGQISNLDSTGSEQGRQSVSGMAGGSVLTGNQIVAGESRHQTITGAPVGPHHSTEGLNTISSGGAQHIMGSSTTSSSQQSSQINHSQSSLSHQVTQSHTGHTQSAGNQIETNEIRTGGGQQNTNRGTTSSSQNSLHTNHIGLTGSGQHGSSVSGSPPDSGLVGHQAVTGGQHQTTTSGASSWQTSSHIGSSVTSVSHQTGASSSGVPVGSSTHGQLQEAGGTTSSSSQGQQQQTDRLGSAQHNLQSANGSSSHVTVQISGSNMSGAQQSTSSHLNDVAGTHISTMPGHGKLGTCGAPLKTALCLFDVYAMYAYDAYSGTCVMVYDCSLHGNKFRTLQACRQACAPRVKYPPLSPSDRQRILNLTRQTQSTVQSAFNGTQISQLPAGRPALPGSAQVSVSQGKLNASTQQGQQSFTGPTEAGKQVSSQGHFSAGQVITRQSTVGGGVSVTHITAQEKHEMDKAAAIDEEWFNQQGKISTLEEQQKFLRKMKLRSVKVSKPKPVPIDQECLIRPPLERTEGCRQRWYYNKSTKTCLPSCSKKAPFSNKIQCDGVCRTLEACDFPMASLFCFFRRAHVVYIYNQHLKQCIQGYDCSNFGNKFPTLQECQNTCRLYEEQQLKISAKNTTEVSIKQKKIMNVINHEHTVLQSSTSSAQGSLGSQTGTGIPTPVHAVATGGADLPARVPAIQAENNNLPTSGNSASQGQATATVKTGKK